MLEHGVVVVGIADTMEKINILSRDMTRCNFAQGKHSIFIFTARQEFSRAMT
jgi:hypothetical protein